MSKARIGAFKTKKLSNNESVHKGAAKSGKRLVESIRQSVTVEGYPVKSGQVHQAVSKHSKK